MKMIINKSLKIMCCLCAIVLLIYLFISSGNVNAEQQERIRISSRTGQRNFSPGEVLNSIALGYPGMNIEVNEQDQDWTIRIGNTLLFWANGRFLPESERENWRNFAVYPVYRYQRGLPIILPVISEDQRARLQRFGEGQQRELNPRSTALVEALFDVYDRESTEQFIVETELLGHEIEIHRYILPLIRKIDAEIRNAALTNTAVRSYINNISHMPSYFWRNIANSPNRSNHSYGIAIDIIPKDYSNQAAYWLWSSQIIPEWYEIPIAERHAPPDLVIQIFEKYGFIWGGKWLYFDSIHFEYRPEILALNGFPITNYSN